MYHDQGLPVIKHDGFGNAVNVTLGLPILRTSVDHGTALSLARTGKADTGSLEPHWRWRSSLASASRAMAVRKRFGQHFLHDPAVIRRIVDCRRARRAASASSRWGRAAARSPGACSSAPDELDVIEIDRDLARSLDADPRAEGAAARARRERARHRLRAPARRRSAAADRGQPALQHLDAVAVSSAEPARRDRRHAFHAAEGGRGSHGGGSPAARSMDA